MGALAALPGLALAGPAGEQVVAGSAAILRPDAKHTQIEQGTHNAIVNWQQFSIAGDEYVLINQPSVDAAILNRVVGVRPSSILGHLSANGRVFIVNPNGVYFGQGSRVDVGALAASVLDIGNDDFMSGRYVFTRPGDAPDGASVVNEGEIKVGERGYVVLAGDYVNNSGVIEGRLGTVVLAAGRRVTLDLSDTGLVNFTVDEAVVSALAGVENLGEIAADGGRVLMTAKVAHDLAGAAVNNAGLIRAHRIVEEGGEVYLRATGGDIAHSGVIDVAGEDGQDGGRVRVTADGDIRLAGGSEIRAGGDGATGRGGTVRVIADGHLNFSEGAAIGAAGGTAEAGGGAVELSGHEGIRVRGTMDVGKGGQAVLDPAVLRIANNSNAPSPSYGGTLGTVSIGRGFIENALNSSVDVTLVASDSINAVGGPFTITATGGGDLALRIGTLGGFGTLGGGSFSGTQSGFFNCSGDGMCAGGGGGFAVAQGATGSINLSGININVGGAFTASAGFSTGGVNLGNVNANGNVFIQAANGEGGGNISVGNVTAASNALDLFAFGGNITAGALTLTGSNVDLDVRGNFSTGMVTINGPVVATATLGGGDARIDIDAQTVVVNGNITASATNPGASAFVDIRGNFTTGAVTITGNVLATANGGELSISISGGNVTVNGNVTATQLGNSYADIDIFANTATGTVAVSGNIVATALAGTDATIDVSGRNVNIGGAVRASGEDASIDIRGDFPTGTVTVGGAVTAVANGSFGWASISIDANAVDLGGPVIATALNGEASIGIEANGPLTISRNVTATARSFADISISGANLTIMPTAAITAQANSVDGSADIFLKARTFGTGLLTVGGPVTVTAGSFAEATFEGNTVSINAPVTVTEAGGGFAGIFVDWNTGQANIGGPMVATAGPGGEAFVNFSGAGGFTARNVIRANGGAGDEISIRAGNFIQTTPAGLLDADVVDLSLSGVGPPNPFINVRTRSPDIYIGTLLPEIIPDVSVDNRAFAGASEIEIGLVGLPPSPSIDRLRAARFLATGPLLFPNPLTVGNLIVNVTAGRVTFAGGLNIGSLGLPLSPTDIFLFDAMRANGLTPPGHGMNASILAFGGIDILGGLTLADPYPYVRFGSGLGPVNIGNVSVPGLQSLVVYAPMNPLLPVSIEAGRLPPPPLGTVGINSLDHFFNWPNSPGTTFAIGEGAPGTPFLTGPITIGRNGPVDIGLRNLFIVSLGAVSGKDRLLTAGVFEIIPQLAPRFEIPTIDEFSKDGGGVRGEDEEEEKERDAVLGEGDEDNGEVTELSEESTNSENMECGA